MNIGEIAERFIRAAEVERAMPGRVGPAPVRSLPLPYVHDWTDKMGWRKERGDKLTEDPLAEERRIFWERMGLQASASELSELEQLRDWLMLVNDQGQRRALLAWAMAKAGGRKFKTWCFKVEGIHPETGRRRKNRALAEISRHVRGEAAPHSESQPRRLLLDPPEIEHLFDTLDDDASERKQPNSWLADGALSPVTGEGDFNWSQKRNERRRQREAARLKREAAKGSGRQTDEA